MRKNRVDFIQLYKRYNWILMFLFLILSIIDFRFGIMALLCIIPAFGMAMLNGNRKFCTIWCPRGNFLIRILKNWYKDLKTPALFRSKVFKNILFIVMFSMFIKALIDTDGNLHKIGFVFFRFIFTSTIISIILGLLYKPRTWCQICPLGQGSQITGNISHKIKEVYDKGS